MERLLLNGRETSRLGFGGSVLGSTSAREAHRLLQSAFDLGIRHFDVAPLYGFGKSERLLGEAFGSRRHEVTLTTKYGLETSGNSSWVAPIHRAARSLLKNVPAVKRRLQAVAARTVMAGPPDPPLTAEGARASLEHSLRELGTDRLDLFLLHEATPERLNDATLLAFLQEQKDHGIIGGYGIGSGSDAAQACLASRPPYCPLLQFEWSVLGHSGEFAAHLRDTGMPHIVHGSLGGRRAEFTQWLLGDRARVERWSSVCGVDLLAPGIMPRLMLKASLVANPHCIVLFSTKSTRNVEDNVRTASDGSLDEPARRFGVLAQAEFVQAK